MDLLDPILQCMDGHKVIEASTGQAKSNAGKYESSSVSLTSFARKPLKCNLAIRNSCLGRCVVGQEVGPFWIHFNKQSLQHLPGNLIVFLYIFELLVQFLPLV